MKVSVIIPIFNCGKYLENSIPQILGQSHTDLELILVNDGSTDNSLALCEKFAAADDRVQVISKEKSEGAGPARNSGIDAASGEYLMFIDADDQIEPNMVERLLNAIVSEQCQVAICGYETYVEGMENADRENIFLPQKTYRGKEVQTLFATYFPEGIVGYLWNKIYDAKLIREKNIRYPDMRRLQDGVFNVEVFRHATDCCVIEDILYHYRLNAQTDLFRKLPQNYYDLIRQFSESFLLAKTEWGDFSDEKIDVFFLGELGSCLENAVSAHWNMTKPDRRQYFSRIANDPFFVERAAKTVPLPRYRRILIALLKNRHFALLEIIVRTKGFVKIRMKKLFFALKRK